jgi:type III pantothenate kinase
MIPDVVVDVGNTRIKWGRCSQDGPPLRDGTSLPADDSDAWQRQIAAWGLPSGATWVVSGVHPARRDRLVEWLRRRGDHVQVVDSPEQLPLRVLLDEPQNVGIDRLLSAVGVNYHRGQLARLPGLDLQGVPAVIVTAGTAVTVDLVGESGAFRGGAILPGFHMMARALHDHTALLPLINPFEGGGIPELPGTSTRAAMRAGVFWAVVGGVRALIERYAEGAGQLPDVWITGGDYHRVASALGALGGPGKPDLGLHVTSTPNLTLLGLRLAAEALP